MSNEETFEANDGTYVRRTEAEYMNSKAVPGAEPYPELLNGEPMASHIPDEATPMAEATTVEQTTESTLDDDLVLGIPAPEGADGAASEVETTTDEGSPDEPVSDGLAPADSLQGYIDRANEYSEAGYPDEMIDQWMEQPEEVRSITHPDGSTRMVQDPEVERGLSERQEKILMYELHHNGYNASPAQVKFLAESYKVPEQAVMEYLTGQSQNRVQQVQQLRAHDLQTTGLNEAQYDAAVAVYNSMPAAERQAIEAQLNNPGSRNTALLGLSYLANNREN